jgi:2-polyprenyl-3-methyl-5-hydroxy-6-metoxy-1,4-benzoquinol methylase
MTVPLVSVSDPPLQPLDRILRSWRIRKIRPYLRRGCSVLDIGCHDGALFSTLSERISRGVGIDPMLERSETHGRFRFIADTFPSDLVRDERFDVITLLAILEHVRSSELPQWREAFERLVVPGGLIVATVPSPRVDHVLDVLTRFRVIAGMSLEEHHGFDVSRVPSLLSTRSIELMVHRRFELGMNNLYVFKKSAA